MSTNFIKVIFKEGKLQKTDNIYNKLYEPFSQYASFPHNDKKNQMLNLRKY